MLFIFFKLHKFHFSPSHKILQQIFDMAETYSKLNEAERLRQIEEPNFNSQNQTPGNQETPNR